MLDTRFGSWPIPALLFLVLLSPTALFAAGPQTLPVTLEAESGSNQLVWSDPAGPLSGETPWVLRSDLMGPDTWLSVETSDGGEARCAEAVRFSVLAASKVTFRVELTSDLAGKVRWRVLRGRDHSIRLNPCLPRPSDDRRACTRGGIPRPLVSQLVGAFEARFEGSQDFVPVTRIRFERSPACGHSTTE